METGAVTFLDLLGWKGIWTRELSYTKPVEKLRGMIESIRTKLPYIIDRNSSFSKEIRGISPRIESISDTIIVFSEGSIKPTLRLHGDICSFLIYESIVNGIPLRGATCYGQYYISEEHMMVGPTIDEAASWHEASDWIGVMLTPSAYFNLHEVFEPWTQYDKPPIKTMTYPYIPCVNWVDEWEYRFPIDGREKLMGFFTAMGPLDTTISIKYANTLSFYDKVSKSKKEKHEEEMLVT
jgi:hypothetical protein